MKLTFLSFLLLPLVGGAQNVLWEKSFGGKQDEIVFDVLTTSDNGYLISGASNSIKNGNKTTNPLGNFDYWVVKTTENGDVEWQKSFGGTANDFVQKVQPTRDGGYLIGGNSNSPYSTTKKQNAKGLDDIWLVKTDAKGTELWQKGFGGEGIDQLVSITQVSDGYILGGTTNSTKINDKSIINTGNTEFLLIKIDDTGKILWQRTFGGKYNEALTNVLATKDGGFLVAGTSNSIASGGKTATNFGLNDYWVIKTDKLGIEQWQTTYGGSGDDVLSGFIAAQDGTYMLAGSSNSEADNTKTKASENGTDFWVLKINEAGSVVWQNQFNQGAVDLLDAIEQNADRSFLIGGYVAGKAATATQKTGTTAGEKDYAVLRISENGELLWTKYVGSNGDDQIARVTETRDGGYFLAGTSSGEVSRDRNTAIGNNDFWIVKLKDLIKARERNVLVNASPNPTKGITSVRLDHDYAEGTAQLIDISGRVLHTFTLEGERNLNFDLGPYPEGVYILDIKTNIQNHDIKVIKN